MPFLLFLSVQPPLFHARTQKTAASGAFLLRQPLSSEQLSCCSEQLLGVRLDIIIQSSHRCCYLVSLWTVTRLSRGLYFLTSNRSGVVRLFFVVV
ncbi:hypothetical protein ASG81_11095 [Paenibacillus sp. Soil522]|nr:hypothetical protein ASG81_11095 [Paenibacillus sp. Soil522]